MRINEYGWKVAGRNFRRMAIHKGDIDGCTVSDPAHVVAACIAYGQRQHVGRQWDAIAQSGVVGYRLEGFDIDTGGKYRCVSVCARVIGFITIE